ncbi:MAG: hypothetical protein AAB907_03120 [Patescibacteria group bacterium]
MEVIPGILEKEWSEIEKKIELVRPFAQAIHIDIIDGKFAPNTTFLDPTPFKKYSSDIFFELHMMVVDPLQYLKPFADAGFRRFLGHIEKMPSQEEFVAKGQLLGEVGLAIDGPTALSEINVPLDDLDALLCMSIKAGFSGQKFEPTYIEKLEMIQEETWIPIEIDGGINSDTMVKAASLGGTRFVSTSFIFSSQNPEGNYKILQDCVPSET